MTNEALFSKAVGLLDEALRHLDDRHGLDCARSRDDFDCTCGKWEAKADIEAFLESLPTTWHTKIAPATEGSVMDALADFGDALVAYKVL